MKRVLLIKNEQPLAQKIAIELEQASNFTVTRRNNTEGLLAALEENWNLILLEWRPFSMAGPQICRDIRAVKTTPIIMVTERTSIKDRVEGLNSGADDYLIKPFAMEELVARINAVLRRTEGVHSDTSNIIKFKDIFVDETRNIVGKGDEVLQLTKREYDLLVFLIKNKNKVLDRELLLNQVWGYDVSVNPNVVDLYIGYLRSKLKCQKNARYIQTKHGQGYIMLE